MGFGWDLGCFVATPLLLLTKRGRARAKQLASMTAEQIEAERLVCVIFFCLFSCPRLLTGLIR
jgi:hypothetical protein